jgi:Uncharacterised protein family (UPF0137)
MSKMQNLLEERLSGSDTAKVKALAKRSASGELSGFSGLFKPTELSETETRALEALLQNYSVGEADVQLDLNALVAITSEVKAINNQASILHGERIMRAQKILKNYRDGAFSAWLVATYGNRQTPYNFLLYYEFYQELPQELKTKLENVPRQAIYTLASRDASFEDKKEIVSSYSGQTKQEMLEIIRSKFPLPESDRRRSDEARSIFIAIERLGERYQKQKQGFSHSQNKEIAKALRKLLEIVTAAQSDLR